MIFPLGSVVNALAIVIGAVVGLLLHGRLPENMRRIVFQGLGLCVVVIGMQMVLREENFLPVALSVLMGKIVRVKNHFNRSF